MRSAIFQRTDRIIQLVNSTCESHGLLHRPAISYALQMATSSQLDGASHLYVLPVHVINVPVPSITVNRTANSPDTICLLG